jgi:CMP-N,N'-diacetyllegionaminic acid synthase
VIDGRSVLAIIPARGGSKRIPRKNLQLYRGEPLIVHSVRHALGSKVVDRTVVSTEDDEIRKVAESAGAEVVRRPTELAGDTATSESALLHVLDALREAEGWQPELVVFLQCTSPARRPEDIDAAVATLLAERADSLFSAVRFDKYVWTVGQDGAAPLNYDYRQRWRDQEFPPQFQENGSIYVFTPGLLRSTNNRLGGRIAVYEMRAEDSFQVDHPGDLERRS